MQLNLKYVLATLIFFSQFSYADDNQPIASINDQPISQTEFNLIFEEISPQFSHLPPEQLKATALSALIEIHLLAQQAKSLKLDEENEFIQNQKLFNLRALHAAFIKNQITKTITEEDLKKLYDKEFINISKQTEIHARHILVKTEEEAIELINKINKGEDFETIAKEKSTGPTGSSGGDLGYFTKGSMVPEFEEAAFALEKGAITQKPVKTQFGFHVIKLEDTRPVTPPPFEEVKDQLLQVLTKEKYLENLQKIKKSSTIVINDKDIETTYNQLKNRQN